MTRVKEVLRDIKLKNHKGEYEMALLLDHVIKDAKLTGKLILGLFSAGRLIEREPHTALLCVMSKEDPDVDPGGGILLYLLESACWACNIPVLRVDNFIKIAESLGITSVDGNLRYNENCIMIRGEEDEAPSKELNDLKEIGFACYNEGIDFEVNFR